MGRPSRVHFPGAVYHIMSRGNWGHEIFQDRSDWGLFRRLLGSLKQSRPFKLHAYCLMPNHFHLLLEVDRFPASTIMQFLLCRFSMAINRRLGRQGHLFQSRYKALLVQRDPYVLNLLRYIHLNPCKAGLAREAAEWHWSSHRDYLAIAPSPLTDTDWLLSFFDSEPRRARLAYREFITKRSSSGSLDGLETLQADAANSSGPNIADSLSGRDPLQTRPIAEIASAVAQEYAISVEELCGDSRLRSLALVRRGFAVRASTEGHRSSAIAAFLHRSQSVICEALARSPERKK